MRDMRDASTSPALPLTARYPLPESGSRRLPARMPCHVRPLHRTVPEASLPAS